MSPSLRRALLILLIVFGVVAIAATIYWAIRPTILARREAVTQASEEVVSKTTSTIPIVKPIIKAEVGSAAYIEQQAQDALKMQARTLIEQTKTVTTKELAVREKGIVGQTAHAVVARLIDSTPLAARMDATVEVDAQLVIDRDEKGVKSQERAYRRYRMQFQRPTVAGAWVMRNITEQALNF